MSRQARRASLTVVLLFLVFLALLPAHAAAQSDIQKRILGQSNGTIDSEKYKDAPPKERLVFFFRDGTGAAQIAYSDTRLNNTFSFTWVLSEDGRLIKTEDRQGRVYVARVTVLSDKALRIEGASHVNGAFVRVGH